MFIFYLLMMFRQLAPDCGSINFDLVTFILMWDVVESIALFTYVFGIFPI